jgi:hypothetical protein
MVFSSGRVYAWKINKVQNKDQSLTDSIDDYQLMCASTERERKKKGNKR